MQGRLRALGRRLAYNLIVEKKPNVWLAYIRGVYLAEREASRAKRETRKARRERKRKINACRQSIRFKLFRPLTRPLVFNQLKTFESFAGNTSHF